MDVPVGVQVLVFTVYVTWSVTSIIIGLGIVRLLEDIRNRMAIDYEGDKR